MKNLISSEDSLLLVIDVQERLIPVIEQNDVIVQNTCRLLEGANLLKIPVFFTEQYPKGLGPTIPAIAERLPTERKYSAKKTFSCCGQPEFLAELVASDRSQIVLCGVETHVCVLQTALDLLVIGKNVAIATNAVGSRSAFDYEIALRRLEQAGAVLCTTEMILFEWCKTAEHTAFKEISRLVVGR